MKQTYNYRSYPYIAQAMKVHNETRSGPRFTLLDFNILCLVKSFHDARMPFFMSNDQLANQLISCEKTIRTSINRLCKAEFLKKESKPRGRCLTYQAEKVTAFVEEMTNENKWE